MIESLVRTEKELEDLEKKLTKEAQELDSKKKEFKKEMSENKAKFDKYIKTQMVGLDKKQKFKQDQKKFSAYVENKIKTLKSMEKKSTTTDPRRGKITKVTEPVSVFKAKKVVVPTKK